MPLKCFERAIRLSGSSSPGPDGVPFKAWRKLGPLGAKVLHAAFIEMIGPTGPHIMQEEWATFNESVMVFLPKKASGALADGTAVYEASSMRPLNITNTDNRVLCSAIRLHVEPIVAPGIDATQRGFLRGRSMLANVVDIDEAMAHAALEEDDAAAVFFFDFEPPSTLQRLSRASTTGTSWKSSGAAAGPHGSLP